LNTHLNVVRRWFGMPYWSLSAYLKHKVKRAVNYIGEFEQALSQEARRNGAQGVICGHIHHAAIRQVGELTLDPNRREMRIGQGEPISLTPLESRLLDYLMLNAGHVLTAEAIIEHVWGPEGGDRDTLRQLVHRLRSKIVQACLPWGETDLTRHDYVETVPGLGYGLVIPPSAD